MGVSGGSFPWHLGSPPEFIQNLITAVADHVVRLPTTVLRTSTTGTSTSGTNTAPSSAAPTAASGTPMSAGKAVYFFA